MSIHNDLLLQMKKANEEDGIIIIPLLTLDAIRIISK